MKTRTNLHPSFQRPGILPALFLLLMSFGVVSVLPAQVTTGQPVKVKIKAPKARHDTFQGEVMNFTNSAITVRDRKNFALLRTFSFSPELARKLENRRMEPGRRVSVRYIHGSDTAVALKGKIEKEKLPYAR